MTTLFSNRTSRSQHQAPDVSLNPLGSLEVKKPHHRPPLGSVSTIEIEIAVGNEIRSVQGEGRFDVDEDLGRVFRIHVADKPGDFELLIPESNWKGIFQLSSRAGCEYKVSLVTGTACIN